MMMFSIIIPTYNQAHLIHRCLSSLIAQTYKNWEAIVINNYSSDDTIRVVRSFEDNRIQLFNFKNNGVIAASRNYGISKSNGDWICFLDSDDYWTYDKLEATIPYLDRYDLIYTNMYKYDKKLKICGKLKGYQISRKQGYEQMLLSGNPIINSSVVINRSLIKQVGGISENPELATVEDFDFWLRIVRYGAKVKHINDCLGFYYIGEGLSFTQNQILRLKKLYEIHLQLLKNIGIKVEITKRLRYRQGRWLQSIGVYRRSVPFLQYSFNSKSLKIRIKSLIFILKAILQQKNDERTS